MLQYTTLNEKRSLIPSQHWNYRHAMDSITSEIMTIEQAVIQNLW
ncbi:hypothetical protein [Umezakia ovalisporum]|nr:hypothetical protein [Umezakia ovalisporum]